MHFPGDADLTSRLPESLIVLGSGTALPTTTRGSPGYLLGFPDGSGVLLDAGPGSVRAAAHHGFPLERLRGVLLTHFHPDHCLDLFALLFGLRNPAMAGHSVLLLGPVGLKDLCERMTGVFGDWVRLREGSGDILELEPGAFQVEVGDGVLQGEAVAMPHLAHSLGYRIHGSRQSLAYSGDTGPGDAVVELGEGADLYLLEAAFPDGKESAKHLTPTQAAQLAEKSGCQRLLLTHFYPETDESDVLGAATQHFSGSVLLAEDGMRLHL